MSDIQYSDNTNFVEIMPAVGKLFAQVSATDKFIITHMPSILRSTRITDEQVMIAIFDSV